MMKKLALILVSVVCVAVGLVAVSGGSDAAPAKSVKTLPSFTAKTLEETEVRLSDPAFKDKPILVVAFTTWNDVSRRQAQAVQAFSKAHPEVAIVAFIVDDLATARDFRDAEGLTFPCYKTTGDAGGGPKIAANFRNLFEIKKGKPFQVNSIPFAVMADKTRKVVLAQVGFVDDVTLGKKADEIR